MLETIERSRPQNSNTHRSVGRVHNAKTPLYHQGDKARHTYTAKPSLNINQSDEQSLS